MKRLLKIIGIILMSLWSIAFIGHSLKKSSFLASYLYYIGYTLPFFAGLGCYILSNRLKNKGKGDAPK